MWNVQYLSISFNKSFFQNILLLYVQRRTIKNPRALQTLQIRKFKTTFLVRYLEKKLKKLWGDLIKSYEWGFCTIKIVFAWFSSIAPFISILKLVFKNYWSMNFFTPGKPLLALKIFMQRRTISLIKIACACILWILIWNL